MYNSTKISDPTKYFLYARKSSEGEDRQIQSTADQIKYWKDLSNALGLEIVDIYEESKSAKLPNNRPLFEEMIKRIEKGEAGGILTWAINRLSRNPIDSARIQWMLQQGGIKSIKTADREYRPEDNTLLFSVETGMANQFLLDLSKNVKRGMQGKRDRGQFPHKAPAGYLNDKAEKTIVRDPVCFSIIRQCWNLMLTGNYSVPQIVKIANEEWHYISPKSKHMGGKPLSYSVLYKVFSSLFYVGIIEKDGVYYHGTHEPMATREEYDHVQVLLGRKAKAREKDEKRAIGYRGFVRCGKCGCQVTSETKKGHIYYHCSHAKDRRNEEKCDQRKCYLEKDVERLYEDEIMKFTILPEFTHWALEAMRGSHETEVEDRTAIYEGLHKRAKELQAQLDNLVRMLYTGRITEASYDTEKKLVGDELELVQQRLRRTEGRADDWLELSEKAFYFATYARKAFITGDTVIRREIMMCMGYSPYLLDGSLHIDATEWLQPILTVYPKLEEEYRRLELPENWQYSGLDDTKKEALQHLISSWQGYEESNLDQGFWRPM